MPEAAPTTVTSPLDEVRTALAAFPLRFHLPAELAEGSVSLAELADPAVAQSVVRRQAAVRGFDVRDDIKPATVTQLAASLTVQGIAMRLGGAVLAALVLERRMLTARAEDIRVAPVGPMWAVALTDAEVEVVPDAATSLDAWRAHWVDGHLRRLVDDIHRSHRVGRALLWGNVASAVASSFVFFDWWDPAIGAGALAERMLDIGEPRLRDDAWMTDVEVAGRVGLRSERKACCLMTAVPGAHLCPSCPKITEAERRVNTAEHVHHLFAVRDGAASGPPPWAAKR